MGTIKTTNIETITGSGTLTLGQSGETINIPSGCTITNNGTQTGFGLTGWSEDGANNNLLPASASAGIYLGVNSATASNLLDDYEEGTWTPSFNFSSGSVGYSAQVGIYRKIGKTVHVQFALVVNSASSPSGSTSITGLPFTSLTTGNSESSAYLGITRNLGSAHNNLRAYVNESNTVMQLPVNSTSSGFSGLPASDLQNTTQIFGNATYFTD
jgi:hypothetical protein